LAGITACAGPSSDTAAATAEAPVNDPAEPVNRAIFSANQAVDRAIVRPIAQAYQNGVPKPVRSGIHDLSMNLKEPATVANDLLQGNISRAWIATRRFAINTTVGRAGLVDVAAECGLAPHSSDFGETLAVWGFGEGPFIELPGLGPSNLRDAVGAATGIVLDPVAAAGGPLGSYLSYAGTSAGFLDARSNHLQDLDELELSSMDYYSTLRSVYHQARQAEIDEAKGSASGPYHGHVDILSPEKPH